MKFFGVRYQSPAYYGVEQVSTPVGQRCDHCAEVIVAGDDGWIIPLHTATGVSRSVMHRACHLRRVVGSVAHQKRECLCFVPGSAACDDPALTRRQNAEAAERYFEAHAPFVIR